MVELRCGMTKENPFFIWPDGLRTAKGSEKDAAARDDNAGVTGEGVSMTLVQYSLNFLATTELSHKLSNWCILCRSTSRRQDEYVADGKPHAFRHDTHVLPISLVNILVSRSHPS